MTTTPLPPPPKPFVDMTSVLGAHTLWAAQMQAYAIAARADLEAENKRLREALIKAANALDVRCAFGDADAAHAALKEQP